MNIQVQRIIDRYVGVVLCGFFSLAEEIVRVFKKPESKEKKPETILIVLLSEMGSLVLAYPMFMRLMEKYPGLRLRILLFEKNREIVELIGAATGEDIHSIDDSGLFSFVWTLFKTIIAIRKQKPDVCIDCELFTRVSSLLSFFSGAKIRAGFHPHTQEGLYRGSFINRPVLYNPYQHISRQFLTLAESIDSGGYPLAKRKIAPVSGRVPLVQFRREEPESLKRRICNDFGNIFARKLVLIYPGGGLLPIRAWPPENYQRLSRTLASRGYSVAVIGLGQDKQLARSIVNACDNPACIDLTGYTKSIRELMVLFHLSELLITNDGGPGHFAAMTPIRTMMLFGPETPVLYGSLDPDAIHWYEGLSCSPCLTAYNHRNSPCDGDNVCLKEISWEKVAEKALEILGETYR